MPVRMRTCLCEACAVTFLAGMKAERARTHLSPRGDGRQPASHESTTHRLASQPTLRAPRIFVQSIPSPVEAQPPQESSAWVVSMHSYPPTPDITPLSSPLASKWCLTASP